ncbi:1706_t:CDS:1 [Dentiscutata erythropus]|uniref:1706_t:CDS:1 n=1 Tax=Dentiscutata erythropus TaxID=1348616 RepID=A0A9N9IL11_9GLOM|nr:1706_t:CDS:1 [Dentiscutata erythropus]
MNQSQPLIPQPLVAQPLIPQPLVPQPLIPQPLIPQPLIPQTADIPVNSSFDNLSAEQKYENLTKGTADLFNTRTQETQETENRSILQFSTDIFSGSSFH